MSNPIYISVNGKSPENHEYLSLATSNYGHFTSFQVRNYSVQGLDLHLERLQDANQQLFSTPIDLEKLRLYLKSALQYTDGNVSARITVFSKEFSFRQPHLDYPVDILITLSEPFLGFNKAINVKTYFYEKAFAEIKHTGMLANFYYRKLARLDGFDDALFIDNKNFILEGSVWNIGFFNGENFLFPKANYLNGITQQLLKLQIKDNQHDFSEIQIRSENLIVSGKSQRSESFQQLESFQASESSMASESSPRLKSFINSENILLSENKRVSENSIISEKIINLSTIYSNSYLPFFCNSSGIGLISKINTLDFCNPDNLTAQQEHLFSILKNLLEKSPWQSV